MILLHSSNVENTYQYIEMARANLYPPALPLSETALPTANAPCPSVSADGPADKSDTDGNAQPSEANVLGHIAELENIGYRTVGTEEAVRGEQYVIDQVNALAAQCQSLSCKVWVQKGSGMHSWVLRGLADEIRHYGPRRAQDVLWDRQCHS
jgi:hypothetical protein